MTKTAIRLLTLAMYATAMMAMPMVNSAKAAGGDTPSPPADSSKDKKKKNDKSSSIDDPKFLEGYRTAYSYRKLGDYKVSQVWYERALQADPNHVRTWQYYGLWQLEQGNRESAQYHLGRIKQICGTDCAEYKSLAMALDKPAGTGLVY
jgi:tetratricopeptide (TPR) repeat protein